MFGLVWFYFSGALTLISVKKISNKKNSNKPFLIRAKLRSKTTDTSNELLLTNKFRRSQDNSSLLNRGWNGSLPLGPHSNIACPGKALKKGKGKKKTTNELTKKWLFDALLFRKDCVLKATKYTFLLIYIIERPYTYYRVPHMKLDIPAVLHMG